jgi:hypothetical protein
MRVFIGIPVFRGFKSLHYNRSISHPAARIFSASHFRVFRIFRGLNSPVIFPPYFGPEPTACPILPLRHSPLATFLWLRLRRAAFFAANPIPVFLKILI